MANNLNGKSSKDVRALLNKKYPTTLSRLDKILGKNLTPRYIKNPIKINDEANDEVIDTTNWSYVRPDFINKKYTGLWVPTGDVVINNTYLVERLLQYNGPITAATIPTSGGRRCHRHTKVKSKKRANKRRTRSRK